MVTHTHDFKRFVLKFDFDPQEVQVWGERKIFSDDLEGWYTGYECDCGEPGYLVPDYLADS